MSTPLKTPRRKARNDSQKLKDILDAIQETQWSLSTFFHHLFRTQEEKPGQEPCTIERDAQHQQMLSALLNGSSKPQFGQLLDLIYKNAQGVGYRRGDNTVPSGPFTFSPDLSHTEVSHAYPAMTLWAVRLVSNLVRSEGEKMIQPDAGLHLCVSVKPDSDRKHEGQARQSTWEAVDGFSMEKMQGITEINAPVLWHITSTYVNPTYQNNSRVLVVHQKRRLQNLITTSAIMALTLGRSNRANLFAFCRGIWLFSSKAAQTVYRVDSRFGLSVASSTVHTALSCMSEKQMENLQALLASEKPVLTVGDNVQTWAKQHDHRIGRESKMLKGYAGTVVEMQDVEEGAFDLQDLLSQQSLQQCRDLSADMILEDIDWLHQKNVSAGDFTQTLIEMVPALSIYKDDMEKWTKTVLTKTQIPKNCRSKIIPLATNSANEIHVQGMKQGLLDFFSTQMGITEETLRNRCFIKSGDGKTFDQLLKLKKYAVSEKGDFESFRWLVPLLELWHTKWTDLSQVARAHWGKDFPDDLSTLAFAANTTESPTPTDL
ncbi:hypothetical protein DXG01_008894 [Tephrocybe rancida]|nr:hypothetical protein DXG01_008894 [Tephrocybe rancida]